ncbi:recombinase family protein [Gammaproteobacteria bacterium LSUCC0112]|nr:recombinase family protein [Gammaproteobacteria bacterium LSUCC0112]
MALIGYARVSTVGQDLTVQMERLTAAGCSKIFASKHSGKSDANKEQLSELLGYVREGDTVVITKLDRLGRSLSQVLNTIELLKQKGVCLRALDQNLDTSDDAPLSQAMVQLLGMFAELERNFIVMRTQEGKIATGRFGGRPSILTDSDRAEIRRQHQLDVTKSALARRFKTSRQTIIRALKV